MAGVGSAKLPADQWLQLYNNVIKDMQGDPKYSKPYDPRSPFYIGGASSSVAAGFGTDFNGLEFAMPPRGTQVEGLDFAKYAACEKVCEERGGVPAQCQQSCAAKYPNFLLWVDKSSIQYGSSFPQSTDAAGKSWDYNKDGVAHYGMLWDFLEDVKTLPDSSQIGVRPCPICPPQSTPTDPTLGKRCNAFNRR